MYFLVDQFNFCSQGIDHAVSDWHCCADVWFVECVAGMFCECMNGVHVPNIALTVMYLHCWITFDGFIYIEFPLDKLSIYSCFSILSAMFGCTCTIDSFKQYRISSKYCEWLITMVWKLHVCILNVSFKLFKLSIT